MFCSKCGNKLENDARFCNVCGFENKKETASDTVNRSIEGEGAKKTFSIARILIVAMAAIIVVMGLYIAINADKTGNENESSVDVVEDQNVDIAISALTRKWQGLYEEGTAGNGHLEIVYTRVVKIDPSANSEFFSKFEKGDLIEYIVEFTLHSDYFGSAPYYHDANIMDTVIIFSDGTTSVRDSILRIYSNYTYSYDYSDLILGIWDYGSAFNGPINLK